MATTSFTISPDWTKAADGPASVLIPAPIGFFFAVTAGGVPAVEPKDCPFRTRGSELSVELVSGESLYLVSPGDTAQTTVTIGA